MVAQLVEQLSILFAAFPFQRSIGRSYYRPLGQLPVKQTTYDPLLLFWGNAALCGEHQGVNETTSGFPHKGKTSAQDVGSYELEGGSPPPMYKVPLPTAPISSWAYGVPII